MNSRGNILSCFTSDVRDLYCKTGNKKIETIYLKLAQSDEQQLFKWLSSSRKTRDLLKNPEIYEALIVLMGIRREFPIVPTEDNPSPVPFDKNDVVKKTMGIPSISKRTPYVLAFASLVNDPRVSTILKPFEDILRAYQETLSQQRNPLSSEEVVGDLELINSEYQKSLQKTEINSYKDHVPTIPSNKIKETRRQKKEKMYGYLRDKFTSDISSAASRSGLTGLSSKVGSEYMLITPLTFMSYFKTTPSSIMINEAKSIAREVLKNLGDDRQIYNYEMIKTRAMSRSGFLNTPQLIEFYRRKEKYDVSKALGNEEKYPTISIQDNQWINPNFMMLIACVLSILKSESERN